MSFLAGLRLTSQPTIGRNTRQRCLTRVHQRGLAALHWLKLWKIVSVLTECAWLKSYQNWKSIQYLVESRSMQMGRVTILLKQYNGKTYHQKILHLYWSQELINLTLR